MRRLLIAGLATGVLAGVSFAGCGGSGAEEADSTFTGVPLALQDPGAVHVHGLGFDKASNVLYLATHTGLFELLPGRRKATRVGESFQDTMGFSAVRQDLWLGSGHPDARSNEPPHLGLIKSVDRGRTWSKVSLSGRADFHILRSAGKRIYGYDILNERLMTSLTEGRTWSTQRVPEPLLDLAIDPKESSHVVATGEAVLYESDDAGRTWHAIASGLTGQLAWPARGSLFSFDRTGAVVLAGEPAGKWRTVGHLRGEPAAVLAVDRNRLFVALHDGTVKRSRNGGKTWTVVATP